MTHFTVLVIGNDVERQLAPYDENMDVAPYREDVTPDRIIQMRSHYLNQGRPITNDEMLHFLWESNWANQKLYKDEEGYYEMIRYNPASKWDWYQIGGRWAGFFWLKEEHAGEGDLGEPGVFGYKDGVVDNDRRVSQALKGEIDWEEMNRDALEKAKVAWEEAQSGEASRAGLYFGYGIEDGDTRETYVKRMGRISTHAVVIDGIWLEQGRMGWFASMDANMTPAKWQTRFDELVTSVPDDTLMTLVDCHI